MESSSNASEQTEWYVSAIPNNLYYISLCYGTIDYAFPLLFTIDELKGIQDTRAGSLSFRGCSEEFLLLIEQLEGINKGDLDVIDTPEQTKNMYVALLVSTSAHDVDNIEAFCKSSHS